MSVPRVERAWREEVLEVLPSGCSRRTFDALYALGLINSKACEELAIRRDIERSIRKGARRVDAFMEAADRFCCSYEKARNIYYKS
ncbi:MAG: hypothetical protein IKU77_06300 [Alistipes sp.]|nr:hypothetical protein [Alistipes sp.]